MKVYLHDIELNFRKISSPLPGEFDVVIEEGTEAALAKLKGNLLFESSNFNAISKVLDFLQDQNPGSIKSITFPVANKELVKDFLKKRYTYIKAAGGLVKKGDTYLFIYRLKKWDLPKGKLEKGEDIESCALREVEEECSVKVKSKAKIGNTWHCYPTKNGWCVKKSTWYLMKCLDDSEMKPQYQEDIEEIEWVPLEFVGKYLVNSYGTIKDVFLKAKKKNLI